MAYCIALGYSTLETIPAPCFHRNSSSNYHDRESFPMMPSKKRNSCCHYKQTKKMVQDKLSNETGQVVLLKDLSNLSTLMKSGSTRNNLEVTVKELTEQYGRLLCRF